MKWIKALILFLCLSCSKSPNSTPSVTEVEHTWVKRQSIGNCWLYAKATWLESLYLSHHGESINVSESYWTWWHWYDQIRYGYASEVNTGGSWYESTRIVLNHGWVQEGEFIAEEAQVEMSERQADALEFVNRELKQGRLMESVNRTPSLIRQVLDEAFQVNMAEVEPLSRAANETVLGVESLLGGRRFRNVTLSMMLGRGRPNTRWNRVNFPQTYGEDGVADESTVKLREQVFKRVMRALNAKFPVVMSIKVDFNALDTHDQTFKKSLLDEMGAPGVQGGHLVVLSDYVVNNVPGYGWLGEGDMDEETKEAALLGELVYLKAKNSWGTNRADRGLTDGYTRFDLPYMTGQLLWQGDGYSNYHQALKMFILPPGF